MLTISIHGALLRFYGLKTCLPLNFNLNHIYIYIYIYIYMYIDLNTQIFWWMLHIQKWSILFCISVIHWCETSFLILKWSCASRKHLMPLQSLKRVKCRPHISPEKRRSLFIKHVYWLLCFIYQKYGEFTAEILDFWNIFIKNTWGKYSMRKSNAKHWTLKFCIWLNATV